MADSTDFVKKFARTAAITMAGMGAFGLVVMLAIYLYIAPNLPSTEILKDTQFQVPLRVYTDDGKLMSVFGSKRRIPLAYEDTPELMIKAVLGAEDDRFFEHPGVDYQGILRAIVLLVLTGEKVQGGSTITMQVARNFFLSREKTFFRKFSEILLAFKIEDELSKEEILELYLNKIYLGNRAYGVAAAARVYYGKNIQELSTAQIAMIAGLPKAPSRYNPIINPKRALLRRDYVLGRMRDLGFITKELYDEAVLEEVSAELHGQDIEQEAPYAAEMVRQQMVEQYGEDVYTSGYKIFTTIKANLQQQANFALRQSLLAYETRHGYRGPLKQHEELELTEVEEMDLVLDEMEDHPELVNSVIYELDDQEQRALVYTADKELIELCWDGMRWAAPYVDGHSVGVSPRKPSDIFSQGDVVQIFRNEQQKWTLGQVPKVEGALVSLRSKDGAIQAVVGGYDFYRSKFNRVDQAKRQPGSNIKPFVYSAALEKGYTAATLINDAPVVFDDPGLEDIWRPQNYSGKVFGPTRLREALVKSRNLVSIRILRSIGIRYAVNHLKNFGFSASDLPKDLSLALGSAHWTPIEVARGYATFSNGGFLVDPYIITRIETNEGEVIFEANPKIVCESCLEERETRIARELALMEAGLNSELAGEGNLSVEDMPPPEEMPTQPTEQVVELAPGELEEAAAPLPQEEEAPLIEEVTQPVMQLAERTISAQNVYIMTSIMRDIVNRGTGRRAKTLGRNDLAGKTGTTNDQFDAWFSGFNGELATTAWVGFDTPQPLGESESGARAALPMWISYMREALKGVQQTPLIPPPGLVTVRIDPESGLLVGADFPGAIFEVFKEGTLPKNKLDEPDMGGQNGNSGGFSGDGTEIF